MTQQLSIQQIEEELKKITYKEGWKFFVYEGAFEGPHMRIEVTLPDSVNLGQDVPLKIETVISPCKTVEDFHLWLVKRLIRIESHETREWFKINGVPVFYPHMDGADRDILQEYYQGEDQEQSQN